MGGEGGGDGRTGIIYIYILSLLQVIFSLQIQSLCFTVWALWAQGSGASCKVSGMSELVVQRCSEWKRRLGFRAWVCEFFLSLAGVSLVSLSYIRDLNLQLGYVSSDGLSFVKRSSDDPGDETDVITKCWG